MVAVGDDRPTYMVMESYLQEAMFVNIGSFGLVRFRQKFLRYVNIC